MTTALAALALVAAVLLLAYGVAIVAIALRFTRAHRVAPPPTPRDATEVSFHSRDRQVRIDGWYLQAPRHRGAVVFVHGKDACRGHELKSPSLELAGRLVAHGLSVLMIDLRGHGSSGRGRLTYSERERFDVLGAVDWLRGQGYPAGRIGVFGASMGATTALRAAALEPAIGAVLADSPFADFGRMIELQYRRLTRLPAWLLPGALLVGRSLTGLDLRRLRPLDEMPALRGRPVVVIHAEADPFVPAEQGCAMAEAAGASLWLTRGTRHIGSSLVVPELYAAVASCFFTEQLLGAQAFAPAANESDLMRLDQRVG